MPLRDRDKTILKKIINYCDEIEFAHKEYNHSFEVFDANPTYRNSVCLCLMQIGELSIKLSDDFKDEYSNIPWKAIRGMRNVVAHEYGNIDTVTVWETVGNDIEKLKRFCSGVLD
jgi:uncharacterized protein with HEPN domain